MKLKERFEKTAKEYGLKVTEILDIAEQVLADMEIDMEENEPQAYFSIKEIKSVRLSLPDEEELEDGDE